MMMSYIDTKEKVRPNYQFLNLQNRVAEQQK